MTKLKTKPMTKETPEVPATTLEKGTFVFGSNGKAYRITDGVAKTVCRVGKLSLDDFTLNNTDDYLPEAVETNNTKILATFLKQHLNDVVLKRNAVHTKGFKITYNGFGFEIIDMWNFNTKVNINDYHNDFNTPEDVLDFVRKAAKRKLEKAAEDKKRTGLLKKLGKKFKVVEDKKAKEKATAKTKKRDEKIKTVKPKRVGLFRGIDLEEPINLKQKGKMVMYTLQGPAKKVQVECHRGVFMAKQILACYPRAMALLMKVCKGELKFADIKPEQMERKFILDPYEPFQPELLKTTKFTTELEKVCTAILECNGLDTPLHYDWDVIDKLKLTKGSKVEVYWPHHFTWYEGKVRSVDKGAKVLYDDGEVGYIYNFHKVRIPNS